MFNYEIAWYGFTRFLKAVLSSRSENTKPVTSGHVKSSQMRNEHLYNPKGFSLMRVQV